MKLNASKSQHSGAFVVEHQKKISAILRRKIAVPHTWQDCKIILDSSQRPQTCYKKKDASTRQFSATWAECYEESSTLSRSGVKVGPQIQFHQSNKLINGLLTSIKHSSRWQRRRNSRNIRSAKSRHHKARSVLLQNSWRDVSWLIKMLSYSSCLLEKEEWACHGERSILSWSFELLSTAISA